jgi:hypothetical protein
MRFIGKDPNILDAFYKATADGSIASGKPVIVTAPAKSAGSAVDFESGGTKTVASVYDSSNNRIVVAYQDDADSDHGKAVVGTVSGSSISFGTPVTFESATTKKISITFDSNANKVVIAYEDTGNSSYGTAIVGTVDPSDNSISFGSAAVFESASIAGDVSFVTFTTFDSSNNKAIISYNDAGNSNYMTAVVGTVSGTSISFGTPVVFESASGGVLGSTFDSNANKVVVAFRDGGDSDKGKGIVGTVSGTSISFGSATQFSASTRGGYGGAVFDSSNNKVVFNYSGSTDGGSNFIGLSAVGTVSGTSISFGSEVNWEAGEAKNISAAFDSGVGKVAVSYMDDADSDQGKVVMGTVSGTSITFEDPVTFESGAITQNTGTAFDSSAGRLVISFADDGDSSKGKSVVVTNDAGGKVTSVGATLGSELAVISSNVNYVESAFDSTNNKVVVACTDAGNSDVGKAFVVSVSGTTCTAGSVVQFSSGGTDNISITFDSANGKVVIFYRDRANSNYGTGIVGTVSSTSISFGTAVVFESANTSDIGSTFDSSNNKVVIGYRDIADSGKAKAQVATVSGTGITFHGTTEFNSASTSEISLAFDSSNNKVIIAYEDNGNSSYGTAIVGTVSGTNISFGSEAVFESAEVRDVNIAFDSTNNKALIVYADVANSNYGTAVVGTVSSTSISYGTPVVYTGTEVGYYPSASFNPDTNKFGVFVYSSDADFYEATISGTSVSFSSSTEINSGSGGEHSVIYDTNADVFVFGYPDSGNSSYGTVVALDLGPALTSENFIGFADDTYAENEQSTIAIVGCIDRNQTSLTAGQQYFVQGDGTLSTTAGSPSVLAGTAISATELVVKE